MAHELTLRADGRAEMAFVGTTPWHGLGQSVTKGASIGVWQREAGMDWEAKAGTPSVLVNASNEHYLDFDDYKAIYRGDTMAPLAIVGAGYNVVQPKEVLEFFRSMTEEGGWHIHTAGTLRGGRKLWAMASRDEDHANVGGRGKAADLVAHNLLFATSLDGSMKTTVADTAVRVVCANTLALSLQDNQRVIQVSHRSVFDAAAVKRALGLAQGSFDAFMKTARDLAEQEINISDARELLSAIFAPAPAKKLDTGWLGKLADFGKPAADDQEGEETRVVSRILDLFEGDGMGAGLGTSRGTKWGLLNAVTQHVDHSMGRTPDTRMDSAWFGRGNDFKQRTLKALVAA